MPIPTGMGRRLKNANYQSRYTIRISLKDSPESLSLHHKYKIKMIGFLAIVLPKTEI